MKTEVKLLVMIIIGLTMLQVSTASRIWDNVGGGHCVRNSYIRACVVDESDGEPPYIEMINPDTGSFDYNVNISINDGSGGDGYLDYCNYGGIGLDETNGDRQYLAVQCQPSEADDDPSISFRIYVTNGDPRARIVVTDVTDSVAQNYGSILFKPDTNDVIYDYYYTPTSAGFYALAENSPFEGTSIILEPYMIGWDESENWGLIFTANDEEKWFSTSDDSYTGHVSRSSATLSWLDENEYWVTIIPNLDDFGSLTDSKDPYCSWEFQEDGTVTEHLSWDYGEDHDLSVSGATHYTNDYDFNESFSDDFADGSRDDMWEDHDEGGTIAEEDGVLKLTDDGGLPYTVIRLDDALQMALEDSDFSYNVTVKLKTQGDAEDDFFGLLLYEDGDNWYRFGYLDGTSSPQMEYGILKKEVGGSGSTVKQADATFGVFDNLRIQKDGTTYRFQNSSDGSTWETFYTVSSMDINPEYVGIGFFESTANTDTYEFDDFELEYDNSKAQWCKTFGCYYFDGSDDYLVTGSDNYEMSAGSFTVSAWAKQPVGDSDYNVIVGWDSDTDGGDNYWQIHYYDDDGSYNFDWKSDGTLKTASSSDFGVLETRWVHVAGVYDADDDEIRLYVNGTLIDTETSVTGDLTTEGDLFVGKNQYGHHLIGTIDDVATFRKALSQEEIFEVMNRHNRYYDMGLPSALSDSNIYIMKTFDYGESSWTTYDDWIDFAHADSGKIEGNNSLRFKIPDGSTGWIYSNEWMGNISEWATSGTVLSLWIKDSRNNEVLRIGSDSNNYREWSIDESGDWSLVELDWDDGSNTGTPDWEWCDYFYLAMASSGGDLYSNVDWFVLKKSGAIGDGSGIGRLFGMSPMQLVDVDFDTNNQEDSNFEWDRDSDSGKLTDWGFDDEHGYSFFAFPEGSTSKSMTGATYDLVSSIEGYVSKYWDLAFTYDTYSSVSYDESAGIWWDFKYAHNNSDFDPVGAYRTYVEGMYDMSYTNINATPYWVFDNEVGDTNYVRIVKTGFEDFYNGSVPLPDSNDGWSTVSVPFNPYFYFGAVDAVDGEWIDEFSVTWDNGTDTYTNSTTDGQIELRWYDIPTGDVMFHYQAGGWNDTWEIHSINDSMPIMNFTMQMQPASLTIRAYDELTSEELRFNMTINNDTYAKSFTNISIYSQEWGDFVNLTTGESTITIDEVNDDYYERTYFLTIDDESILTLNAYLIEKLESHYVNIYVRTTANIPVIGALISVQKYIDGAWKTVSQKETDDAGMAIFYLNSETTYKVKVEYPSYVTKIVTIVPTSYEYTIILSSESTHLYHTIWDDVSYQIDPQMFYIQNTTTNINTTVSCSGGGLNWVSLKIDCDNGTTFYDEYEDDVPNGVSWEKWIDPQGCSEVYVNLSFERSGYGAYSRYKTYSVRDFYYGNNSIMNILPIIGDNDQFPEEARNIAILFIATAVGVGTAGVFGPIAGVMATDLTFGIATFMGWFPLWMLIVGNLAIFMGIIIMGRY